MILTFLCILFCGLCVYAAASDISRLIIPNWLNISIALLAIPAAFAAELPLNLIIGHLIAGAVAFGIGYLLFGFYVIGGGDAKMLPAVALWIGPAPGAQVFMFYTAFAGALLCLTILLVRVTVPIERMPALVRAPFQDLKSVPYGVAIAAGVFAAAGHSAILGPLVPQALIAPTPADLIFALVNQ